MDAKQTLSEGCELVEKLRIKNESLLHKLVKMHLLFELDLSDGSFESLFEPPSQISEKSKHKMIDGIFTCSLTEEGICRLLLLIDFILLDFNIKQEGIFRKCGSSSRQTELKNKLSRGDQINLDSGDYTVHDCANVLKACLSELPEPLLTSFHFKLNHIMCNIISPSMSPNTEKRAEMKKLKVLQLLILLLPTTIRKFVKSLLMLLHEVTLHSEQNKMDSRSLATLFAPHLLCPKNMSMQDMQKYTGFFADELSFMIDNFNDLFEPPKELLFDIRNKLKNIGKGEAGDEDVVDTAITFCERNATEDNGFTQLQLAQLYAQVHNMPDNALKQRLIKKINRQNGGKSPIVVKKCTPGKRVIKCIGSQLRRVGHNIFTRSPRQAKISKRTNMTEDETYSSLEDLLDSNDNSKTGTLDLSFSADSLKKCDSENEATHSSDNLSSDATELVTENNINPTFV